MVSYTSMRLSEWSFWDAQLHEFAYLGLFSNNCNIIASLVQAIDIADDGIRGYTHL